MRFMTLKEIGAIEVEPLTFRPSRPKSHGCMWDGRCVLQLGNVQFHFELWYHGGDEITLPEVQQNISLKGINTPKRYYDVHWYSLMTENEIWLHPKGWFNTSREYQTEMEYLRRRCNYNFDRTSDDFERSTIEAAGFKLFVSKKTGLTNADL
jgi:hypothetical protein